MLTYIKSDNCQLDCEYLALEELDSSLIMQVVYLTRARGGTPSNSSLVNSMFWFSFTIGRFVLTWVIGALPSKWQGKGPMSFFILLAIMLELMVWRLPTFVGSSVA